MSPPIAPTIVATIGVGVNGSAVIATRPARAPLRAIVRSAFPNHACERRSAATSPPAAAMLVLTKTIDTAFASSILLILSSEPPLNPNHPSQRMNVPRVARGRFAPGMALTLPFSYFPFLAPRRRTPAIAAEAPQR